MRIFIALLLAALSVSQVPAQGPATGAASNAAATQPPSVTAPATPAPSHLLQPSLDAVQQTLTGLKLDKWKRGSVRDEAGDDIRSIQQDMQQHLPALLQDADAAPGVLSKTLPLSRHLDALYDVLLRVVEAARIAGPSDQVDPLREILADLNRARLALDDSMEAAASTQEKQMADLRVTVQKQAEFKCPAPPPAPPCPKPAAKRPVRRKPATTTPPAAPGKTSPATPQKPPASGTPKPSAAQPKPGV